MPWKCPVCTKEFKHNNQWHSCAQRSVEDLFRNKSPELRALYDTIILAVTQAGPIQLHPVKTSIQVRSNATFLSIRPKRRHLEIEFQLGRCVEDFPVYKTIRISKNRVMHYAVLESADDLSGQVLGLLRESYRLIADGGKL